MSEVALYLEPVARFGVIAELQLALSLGFFKLFCMGFFKLFSLGFFKLFSLGLFKLFFLVF
jgi:hypothetical protein